MSAVPSPGCSPAAAACKPGPQRGYPAPELAEEVLPEVRRNLLGPGAVVGRHTADPEVVPVKTQVSVCPIHSSVIRLLCIVEKGT